MTKPPVKLSVPLEPLLPRLELDDDGLAILAGAQDAVTGIDRLVAAGRLSDATRLAAHALPKREAVWWACMCARSVPDPKLKPRDLEALTAAELWVRKPEEPTRRAAMVTAEKTGFGSPEAWAAVGAFWSGGSMSPEGQPVVPPPDHLTGVAISGAIVLAAVRVKPQLADTRFTKFLIAAKDIAAGGAGRLQVEEA
ncbi:DUF6931 family protein [Humitalea sp. 24SJ18S-53]|uniref:DUF6931 family protein n=1 Tax=Humitalea sp. 24SJ18S-53 TaxID=3422307 RepID=UPI003D67B91D